MFAEDSLETIGGKLKAIASVNKEIINEIESKKSGKVTKEVNYDLVLELDQSNKIESIESKPWKLRSAPNVCLVSQRIDSWRYSGTQLEVPDGLFHGNIDYNLSTYEDVKRLNEDLLKHGSECCDVLMDKPATRAAVRIILRNLEIIQVAVGQLNELLIDANDESENIDQCLKSIATNFCKIQQALPEATLSLNDCKESNKYYKEILRYRETTTAIEEVLASPSFPFRGRHSSLSSYQIEEITKIIRAHQKTESSEG